MKYIAFCYNYLTLARVIRYVGSEWGKNNTKIVFINLLFNLPQSIVSDYDTFTIKCKPQSEGLNGFSLIHENCREVNKTWNYVKKCIDSINDEVTLIVFKDNEAIESTILEKTKRKYCNRIHVTLIEEGAGIYVNDVVPTRYAIIKKLIYLFNGVSTYCIENHPQAINPLIDLIICTNPTLFKTKKNTNVNVQKMKKIFTEEINAYLIKSVLGERKKYEKYEFVFLTQPFKDWKADYEKLYRTHEELLPKVFEILARHGNTIIKLHPREHFDYSRYCNEKVNMITEQENLLPFECLMQLYGNPQLISMFSSTSINISTNRPSIYLGKIFSIPIIETLFSNEFYEKNNIVLCKTIEEFDELL